MARPERFELPTYCSGGNRSIQLSYGRAGGYETRLSLLACAENTWSAASSIEPGAGSVRIREQRELMISFLLWCLLLVVCWPLAILALVLYPLVWLFLLPFRIVGIAVGGVLELIKAVIFLPARVLGARRT